MINISHKSIKSFEKLILFFLRIVSPFQENNSIRILVYHHIENENFSKFENQIKILKKEWNFITPNEFENHIKGTKKLSGKNLLLTFDDGFKSNFIVANEILKKLDIKAIFFVPSDFIKIKSQDIAINFAKKNILDETNTNDIKNINNFSVDDLKALIKDGHYIGCHTKTHAHLGSTQDENKLKEEILESSKILKELLNINIKHFAYTYGNFKSINLKSLEIASSKYNFVYSCLRGNNFYNEKRYIIKRDTVYLDESNDLLKILLSGFIDLRYFLQIRKINKMIKNLINN